MFLPSTTRSRQDILNKLLLTKARLLSTTSPSGEPAALGRKVATGSQALVATAVGFPPTMFRRMLQSNGATTVLDFTPVRDAPPTVTINRLNQASFPLLPVLLE